MESHCGFFESKQHYFKCNNEYIINTQCTIDFLKFSEWRSCVFRSSGIRYCVSR